MNQIKTAGWARRVTILMTVLMIMVGMAPPLEAGYVSSEDSLPPSLRSQDMALVQKTLENKVIAEQLAAMGYERTEIDQRLAALSDQELHELATQMESMQPSAGAAGAVIAVLVIIVLVLVILRLVGKRVVVN